MIVDLHSHYPMHLVPGGQGAVLTAMARRAGRRRARDQARAAALGLVGRFWNYRSWASGPRVTVPKLRAGGVGVALSVVLSPFDEMEWGRRPSADYLTRLLLQLDHVEAELATHDGVAVARTPVELEAAIAAGRLAFVHAVEGGFHLGGSEAEIDRAVALLARRGVAYVTIAHLFYRDYATNTNAIPFLPDGVFDLLFPQPDHGLTDLGRAAVRALAREGVLIDLSHMSARSVDDTLTMLDEVDAEREIPVVATHVGYRFGRQAYNLDDDTVRRIAARGGVCGVILAQHQLNDGLRRWRSRRLETSLEVLFAHLEQLLEIGGEGSVALGTDLDGFIKPTLNGLADASDLAKLPRVLEHRFGPERTERILSGNALRVLRRGWRGANLGHSER